MFEFPAQSYHASHIALANLTASSHPCDPRTQMKGGPSPSSRDLSSGMTHFTSSLYVILVRSDDQQPAQDEESRLNKWTHGYGQGHSAGVGTQAILPGQTYPARQCTIRPKSHQHLSPKYHRTACDAWWIGKTYPLRTLPNLYVLVIRLIGNAAVVVAAAVDRRKGFERRGRNRIGRE